MHRKNTPEECLYGRNNKKQKNTEPDKGKRKRPDSNFLIEHCLYNRNERYRDRPKTMVR